MEDNEFIDKIIDDFYEDQDLYARVLYKKSFSCFPKKRFKKIKYTNAQIEKTIKLYKGGNKPKAISKILNIPVNSIYYILNQYK
jgi:hypothetical protein